MPPGPSPARLVSVPDGVLVRELDGAARAGLRESAARYRANAARFRTGLAALPAQG